MDIFDSKKAIFDFNYGSALGDATMQRAYFGKKIWMREVEAAKKPVRLLCDRVLHGDFHDQEEYDNEFYKVGHQVCDAINAAGNYYNKDHPNEFTFGNAQKLINMTMKHMYEMSYVQPDLRNCFQWCHCPADNIMLYSVWNIYKSKNEAEKLLGDKYDFLKSWSKEDWTDISRYQTYQKAVRKLSVEVSAVYNGPLIPIEFDYYIWGKSKDTDIVLSQGLIKYCGEA